MTRLIPIALIAALAGCFKPDPCAPVAFTDAPVFSTVFSDGYGPNSDKGTDKDAEPAADGDNAEYTRTATPAECEGKVAHGVKAAIEYRKKVTP